MQPISRSGCCLKSRWSAGGKPITSGWKFCHLTVQWLLPLCRKFADSWPLGVSELPSTRSWSSVLHRWPELNVLVVHTIADLFSCRWASLERVAQSVEAPAGCHARAHSELIQSSGPASRALESVYWYQISLRRIKRWLQHRIAGRVFWPSVPSVFC